MPRYKMTKYVFFCDKCESWYDRNEPIAECAKCGSPVRELKGAELEYFYWRLTESGYRIVASEKDG